MIRRWSNLFLMNGSKRKRYSAFSDFRRSFYLGGGAEGGRCDRADEGFGLFVRSPKGPLFGGRGGGGGGGGFCPGAPKYLAIESSNF